MSQTAVADRPQISSTLLAEGDGWRLRRLVCRAGPESPAFEERHDWTGIALVAAGSFTYRSFRGCALLAPGAWLLATAGACFECGHEHGHGDVCLSFQFRDDRLQQALASLRGAAPERFPAHYLPPLQATVPLSTRCLSLHDSGEDPYALAHEVLVRALCLAHGAALPAKLPGRELATVSTLVRAIDDAPHEDWSLAALEACSGLGPFSLLRSFRRLLGTTPYQYVLRQRLQRAARQLVHDRRPVQDIALDCGFNDLSEFHRRFRRIFGETPGGYRRSHAVHP
jgi:AraC-like DNA-binding protein